MSPPDTLTQGGAPSCFGETQIKMPPSGQVLGCPLDCPHPSAQSRQQRVPEASSKGGALDELRWALAWWSGVLEVQSAAHCVLRDPSTPALTPQS